MGTKPKKRKVKIKFRQSAELKPTTKRNNVGNIGRQTLLANTGNIKVKIIKRISS